MPQAAIDPITLEVLRNRLAVIVDEMQAIMEKGAFSTIVKEGGDASCSLFGARGELLAQATALPGHLGMVSQPVGLLIRTFPELHEGDVLVVNAPFLGGTYHPPDILTLTPIFVDGELGGFGAVWCHHQDVGGKIAGSMACDATDIYQQGLTIPPLKLYDRGVANQTALDFIAHNVRVPDIVLGDLMAQVAAGRTAQVRLQEVIRAMSPPAFRQYTAALLDLSERLIRERIQAIPDGVYSFADTLDDDGIQRGQPLTIRATVTIAGSEFHADFTGTSPQTLGPVNAVPVGTVAAVYYVVKAITDPTIPNNAGCYRPIRVTIPEGSLLNPKLPAAIGLVQPMYRVVDALLGALAQALPAVIPAASSGNVQALSLGGVDPATGKTYVAGDINAGGFGARPSKDGLNVTDTHFSNCKNIPVEALESEFPFRVHKCRLRPDSGGPGRFRGGLGMERELELLRGACTVSHRSERHEAAPWGLFGGKEGARWQTTVRRATGASEALPAKVNLWLQAGDRLCLLTGGSGGHGDPLTRLPDAVLADVRDGYVSVASAYSDYGVVIAGDTLELDWEKTAAERARRAR